MYAFGICQPARGRGSREELLTFKVVLLSADAPVPVSLQANNEKLTITSDFKSMTLSLI